MLSLLLAGDRSLSSVGNAKELETTVSVVCRLESALITHYTTYVHV